MCLYIKKDQKSKICRKDITCYKICDYTYGRLFTFYRCDAIEIGETYISDIWLHKSSPFVPINLASITKGLHSFVSIKSLLNAVCFNEHIRIIKCIIPKGSEYYLGEFENKNDAYASNKLKYLEIVDPKIIKKIIENKL